MRPYIHEKNATLIHKMQQAQTSIDALTAHIRELRFTQSSVDVTLPSLVSTPVVALDAQAFVAFLKDQRETHQQALRDIAAELHERFETEYAIEEPSPADDAPGAPDTGKSGKTLATPSTPTEPGGDLL